MDPIKLRTQEVIEKVIFPLSSILKEYGYLYNKRDNQFILTHDDYKFIYHLVLTRWKTHFSIDTYCFIYQDKIESILKNIIGENDKVTLGNEIGIIFYSRNGREITRGNLTLSLQTETEIDAIVKSLASYFVEIAQPYFARYSTLEGIDDIINNPPFNYCPAHIGGNLGSRCMKGLIIGKLIKRLNYEELLAMYDEAIAVASQKTIGNYKKVKDFLDER